MQKGAVKKAQTAYSHKTKGILWNKTSEESRFFDKNNKKRIFRYEQTSPLDVPLYAFG